MYPFFGIALLIFILGVSFHVEYLVYTLRKEVINAKGALRSRNIALFFSGVFAALWFFMGV